MDRVALYKKLPKVVSDYLFDSTKETPTLQALKVYTLSPEAEAAVLVLADDVLLKIVPLAGLPQKIVEVAKVDQKTAQAIAKDLIGWRLLPLEQYLPELTGELTRLGIDRSAYPGEKVERPTLTPEQFLQEVLTEEHLALSSKELEQRLEFILNSYLRGVRTRTQTVATLGRSVKVGGLEIDETRATRLLDVIDARKQTTEIATGEPAPAPVTKPEPPVSPPSIPAETSVRPSPSLVKDPVRVVTPPSPAFKQQMEEKRKREEGERKRLVEKDAEDLAKRYAAMTGKAPVTPAQAPVVAQASVAVPKRQELASSSTKVDPTAKAVLRQAAPRPVPVLPKLSDESLPPSKEGARPEVADVKYVQKLVGPIEELKTMTLTDFHRLGSDPEQVVMKIQDKVALLKGEAYEKMVAGIQAWRESPINRLYVALSGEALGSGKSVAAVAEAWKSAGKETLTPEEVKAIVKLNTSLRF